MSLPPTASLADPAGSSTLVAAVAWLQGTVLGTVATTIAVIAVAAVGFLMLGGRIDWRRGATVIAGCFLLFGASSIVAGLRGVAGRGVEPPVIPLYTPPPSSTPPTPAPTAAYDPYAGASVRP